MIVIGVDVHKQSLTAVAVDEAGRGRYSSRRQLSLVVTPAFQKRSRMWRVKRAQLD